MRFYRLPLIAVGLLGLSATACGEPPERVDAVSAEQTVASPTRDSDSAAVDRCNKRTAFKVEATGLAAAYDTTLRDLQAWRYNNFIKPGNLSNEPLGPERDLSPDEPITVCFVDGDFSFGTAASDRQPNRAEIVIDSRGNEWMGIAGYHNRPGFREMPVERPPGAIPDISAPPSSTPTTP